LALEAVILITIFMSYTLGNFKIVIR